MSDWIKWYGGECPVAPDVDVEYTCCDGISRFGVAGKLAWGRGIGSAQILAYRVLNDAAIKPKLITFAESLANSPPLESYLEEANRITGLDRNKAYGHPLDNHTLTAAYWSGWINRKYGTKLELCAEDVCWLNSLQKHSREANMQKRDNAVDVIGYLRNVEMITEERERRKLEGM